MPPIRVQLAVAGATPSTTELVMKPGPDGGLALFTTQGAGHLFTEEDLPVGLLGSEAVISVEGSSDKAEALTEALVGLVGLVCQRQRGARVRVVWSEPSVCACGCLPCCAGNHPACDLGGCPRGISVPAGLKGTRAPAPVLDVLVEVFAERWNKASTQEQADQIVAEMERAAEALSAEEIVAYATRPAFRDLLLHVCVFGRARQRLTMPRHAGEARR